MTLEGIQPMTAWNQLGARAAFAALLSLSALAAAFASEPTESDWAPAQNARMRLIAGGIAANGTLKAGIEIRLEPDYKTYWRTPGESGVPPLIDFKGSVNVASADVDFPMPHIYDEPGGKTLGYKDHVVLPVHVKATDPSRPVTLAVKVDYGVCAKICIPAEGAARLTLPAKASSEGESILKESEAKVPVKTGIGAPGELRVLSVAAPVTFEGHPAFEVMAESAAAAEMLAEATPSDWYLEVVPTERQGRLQRFRVSVYDPETGKGRVPCAIRLTLESGDKAIEVPVTPAGCVALP